MGFEVTYFFHPRKDDGGYNTEVKEERLVKVGKPFDETPMEKLAAAIMSQLARRDIWVIDVKVTELVRREISFKECKDGRGITLKNKRFSFNDAAQMVAEDIVEEVPANKLMAVVQETGLQPHELIAQQRQQSSIDDLYANPNKPVPVVRNATPAVPVNQNKTIYKVIFDPPIQYVNEVKQLRLKFTLDKEYSVHQIVPHPTGKLDMQKIIVTDDSGRPVTIEEKYFMTAGNGLMLDKQLGFSGSNTRGLRKPRLAFENEMFNDGADPNAGAGRHAGIPLDDGSIPDELLAIPDIRKGR